MKYILLILFIFAASVNAQLLLKGETELLRFKTKSGKTAIVCTGENESYIVYRFGTNSKVELEYPAAKDNDSWQLFTYSYYFRGGGKENAGLDLNYLTFENNGYTYKLYQEYSAEDNSENAGILVTGANGVETDFKAVRNSVKGSLIDLRYNNKIKTEQ
jgi:hypothetical protein